MMLQETRPLDSKSRQSRDHGCGGMMTGSLEIRTVVQVAQQLKKIGKNANSRLYILSLRSIEPARHMRTWSPANSLALVQNLLSQT
jgi:hypothetical protein